MAALNSNNPTLLDLSKMMDPKGGIVDLVESLSQENEFLRVATFSEGNMVTGDKVSTRVGLPSIAWRKLNEGIATSKSSYSSFTETCGSLEGLSEVDEKIARMSGDPMKFRMTEDSGFLQQFSNTLERAAFYQSEKTTPESMMGLSPRMDSTAALNGKIASQIIKHDGAASGNDQTSIWLVQFHPEKTSFIYPKYSKTAGLSHTDLGMSLTTDASGNKYKVLNSHFEWNIGLRVKDYRSIVRICNIDMGNLSGTGNALIQSMTKAYYRIGNPRVGRLAYFCSRTISEFLQLQQQDTAKNSTLRVDQVEGRPMVTFQGFPVLMSDGLLENESVIS